MRVERHGVAVDHVDHHNFEADIPGGRRNLHQRVEQQLRSDAMAAKGAATSCQGLGEFPDRVEVRLHVLWRVRDRDRGPEPPARLPYAEVGKEQPDERAQAGVVGVPGAAGIARRLRAEEVVGV